MERIPLEWALNGPDIFTPMPLSQIITDPSHDPDTNFRPSGEYAIAATPSIWPVRGPAILSPDTASQMYMCLSKPPDAIRSLSGECATERIGWECDNAVANTSSLEDMSQMATAGSASDLRACHAESAVFVTVHCAGDSCTQRASTSFE